VTEKKLIAASIVAIAVLLVVGGYTAIKLAARPAGSEARIEGTPAAPSESPATTRQSKPPRTEVEQLAAENEALRRQLAQFEREQPGPPPTTIPATTAITAPSTRRADFAVVEITNDPNVLAHPQTQLARLALNGVQLGDASTTIPLNSIIIEASDVRAMKELPAQNAYTTRNGKVVGFLLADEKLLCQLRVASSNGVELLFGKADHVFDTGQAIVYYFYGRQLMVGWKDGRLAVVMVGEQ
jgi:hypothetical protein